MICGYVWYAPYLLSNGKTERMRCVCEEKSDHAGDHRTWDKVITTNTRPKKTKEER